MGAVLLSPLYILLNLYLISRMLLWFSTLHSFLGTPWFIAPFLFCYVLIALSPLMAAFSHGKWKQVSRIISNYWLGTLMYMLIFLLLFDLGRILLRLSRKRSLFDPIDIRDCSCRKNQEKALRCEYLQKAFSLFHTYAGLPDKVSARSFGTRSAHRPYRRSAPRWKRRSAACPENEKNHRQDATGSDHLCR